MAYSVHDHTRLKRLISIAVSPDGAWFAAAVQHLDRDGAKYVSDIWKVPADGSAALQLTRGETRDSSPCFRYDGALGFLSNRQPNDIKPDEDAEKRSQVWILPAGGGEPQQLTDEPLGVEAFKFARSGDRLVMFAPVITEIAHDKQREFATERAKKGPSARRYTQQPVRHWDHWLQETDEFAYTHVIACKGDGGNRLDLTPGAKRELAIEPHFDVSNSGRLVALTWQTPGSDRVLDTTILLIDVLSNKGRRFGVQANVSNDPVYISPDENSLATVRSFRSPQTVMRPTLTLIDIRSGEERVLGRDWDRWPNLTGWSRDGKSLFVTADDQGDTPAFKVNAATGKVDRVTSPVSGGTHSNLEPLPDGRLAGIRSTLLDPPECFVVDVAPHSAPRKVSYLSGLSAPDWVDIERCEVRSTDGAPTQFFFLRPRGAATPLPTLMWIHGGPIGMNADGWHWRWNPLLAVARGYAVAMPNPRGSTGFGQEFIQGIWGNVWGGQCYRDLMCVADSLEKRPDVDSRRIMAMGGSFGGYMTNWIGTQTDRFRCLITHASIFTMAQFTGTTDHPPWWYLEMGGEDPFANQPHFDRYAPVKHVKNWRTPTLIIHGELDYRCPLGEALGLFEALQYHKVPSELLIFPDENHWILKPRNIAVWYETVLDFLDRHMT